MATIIEELKEAMQVDILIETARKYEEVAVVQRLGYILEYVIEEHELSNGLYNYLESVSYYPTLLRPQRKKSENMITGNRWKIVRNVEIESDI